MGKTALVAQVARTAHGDGAIVLFGHADEDVGISYQPWIEVVSTLVRDGDPELVAGLRSAQRTALARLVPEVGSDTDRVADPDTERLLLWEGTDRVARGGVADTRRCWWCSTICTGPTPRACNCCGM